MVGCPSFRRAPEVLNFKNGGSQKILFESLCSYGLIPVRCRAGLLPPRAKLGDLLRVGQVLIWAEF